MDESHSYRWSPGTPGEPLWDKEWMVRAYVDDEPDGDPQATDLILLTSGEAFFDHVASAIGDPLVVHTGAHGALPRDQIASIAGDVVSSPAACNAAVTLVSGRTIEGLLESIDDEAVRLTNGSGESLVLPRSLVARISFRISPAVPIALQTQPAVSRGRRGWAPEQATGPPDTHQAGDTRTAWAAKRPDEGVQWLLLTYDTPVAVAEVRIWETYNPGAVSKVAAVLDDGTEVVLWEGQDPTTAAPEEFVVTVEGEVTANRVKVYLDTTRRQGWNEIDAVELVGRDGSRQWASEASAGSSYADR